MGSLRRFTLSDHLGTKKQPAAKPNHSKDVDQFAVATSNPLTPNNFRGPNHP
jgi:hypothetical protein